MTRYLAHINVVWAQCKIHLEIIIWIRTHFVRSAFVGNDAKLKAIYTILKLVEMKPAIFDYPQNPIRSVDL